MRIWISYYCSNDLPPIFHEAQYQYEFYIPYDLIQYFRKELLSESKVDCRTLETKFTITFIGP